MNNQSIVGKICACSRPATRRKNGDPVCDRCAGISDRRSNRGIVGRKFQKRRLV